ncbi:MAG: AraC family transcriptional regulator [Chitinophagales bacterium]
MKPQLLKVITGPHHSFSVRQDTLPYINNRWHYHPEVELICFHQGTGTQFVGDHIKRFGPGDIVLVGANLPHYWRYDDAYFSGRKKETVYSTVIHFCENFWGEAFLNLPETKSIKTVLEKAKRGIMVSQKDSSAMQILIEKIRCSQGLERMIALLECLSYFGNIPKLTLLSSISFQQTFSETENERMHAIYDYALSNFKEKLYLDKIADVAGLVPNSFCRYFKSRTGKTFTQFLTEIRIGYACKFLIENKLSIKQLCYESGFNNAAGFYKCFKEITGKTPQEYQKEYMKDKFN